MTHAVCDDVRRGPSVSCPRHVHCACTLPELAAVIVSCSAVIGVRVAGRRHRVAAAAGEGMAAAGEGSLVSNRRPTSADRASASAVTELRLAGEEAAVTSAVRCSDVSLQSAAGGLTLGPSPAAPPE